MAVKHQLKQISAKRGIRGGQDRVGGRAGEGMGRAWEGTGGQGRAGEGRRNGGHGEGTGGQVIIECNLSFCYT